MRGGIAQGKRKTREWNGALQTTFISPGREPRPHTPAEAHAHAPGVSIQARVHTRHPPWPSSAHPRPRPPWPPHRPRPPPTRSPHPAPRPTTPSCAPSAWSACTRCDDGRATDLVAMAPPAWCGRALKRERGGCELTSSLLSLTSLLSLSPLLLSTGPPRRHHQLGRLPRDGGPPIHGGRRRQRHHLRRRGEEEN